MLEKGQEHAAAPASADDVTVAKLTAQSPVLGAIWVEGEKIAVALHPASSLRDAISAIKKFNKLLECDLKGLPNYPLKPLVATEILRAALVVSHKIYQSVNPTVGIVWHLRTVVAFLESLGFPTTTGAPLGDVLWSLCDKDNEVAKYFGQVTPRGKPGRPEIRVREAYRQAWAAQAFRLLRKGGCSAKEAKRRVADAAAIRETQVAQIVKEIGRSTAPAKVKKAYEEQTKFLQQEPLTDLHVLEILRSLRAPSAKK